MSTGSLRAAQSSRGRVARRIIPAILCTIWATGCGPASDEPAESWPPTFQGFSFSSDLVVVYPGTCRTVGFTFDTIPPTQAEDLELVVDGGSMAVHTIEVLANNLAPGNHGEGRGVWRICAGLDAPVEGTLRVSYREHPDYFAETRLVQRKFLERLPAPDAAVTLPLTGTYPTDVRWSDDGTVIQVASRTGLILHVDAETGVILRSETTLAGDTVFFNDTHLLTREPDWFRSQLVDRAEGLLLSAVVTAQFNDGDGEPGDIVYAHGAGSLIATAGTRDPNRGGTSIFVSMYDLEAMREDRIVYRFPDGAVGPNYPHLVFAPDASRLAWTGLQVKTGAISTGEDYFPPSVELVNEIFQFDSGTSCSFEGTIAPPFREMSVDTDEPIVSRPAFSADGLWLAHWSSSDVRIGGRDYPLNVYDAETCVLRATTRDTAPNFHRGSVAITNGGDLLAAVSADEVHLYDVPPGPEAALERRVVVPSIATPDLHAGTQSTGFSDRQRLQRRHYQYPGIAFSADDRRLASVNTRGARIYDLEDEMRFVETPEIDPDDVEAFGPWVRVGVTDTDDAPGGDLIYFTGNTPGFVYQLAENEQFEGIDQYGVLVSLVDGVWQTRDLTTGTVQEVGAEAPAWQPALQNATVVVTDDVIELHR